MRRAKRWARRLRELIDRARHGLARLTRVRSRRKKELRETVRRINHLEKNQRTFQQEHDGERSETIDKRLIAARKHALALRSAREKLTHAIRELASTLAKRRRKLVAAVKRIASIRHRQEQRELRIGNVNVDPSNRSGSASVLSQFVEPFMVRRGLPLGSGMRTPAQNAAVGGSPYSDHLTTNTTATARDFPTYSGEDDARALAQAMGIGAWSPNSYTGHYIAVDGYRFRIQILWGSAINHGDHVHVGVRRA